MREGDQHEHILDGWVRFEALRASPLFEPVWLSEKFPHLVYDRVDKAKFAEKFAHFMNHDIAPAPKYYDFQHLLPKMLALAGHYDRAWPYIRWPFNDSAEDIEIFLRLPPEVAKCVWKCRPRKRQQYPRDHRREWRASARGTLSQLQRLRVAHDELGKELTLDNIWWALDGERICVDRPRRSAHLCVNLSRELLDAMPGDTRRGAFIRAATGCTRKGSVPDDDWAALKRLRESGGCEAVSFCTTETMADCLRSEARNARRTISEMVEAHCWWYFRNK